jgi:cobalt transporter subunit CbtA
VTQRLVSSALFAGFVAGLLAAVLHFALVQDLILKAESYETGEAVHFAGLATDAAAASHDHAEGTAAHDHPEGTPAHSHDGEAAGHSHGAGDEDGGIFGRDVLTVLFTALIYVGYALLLVAGFGIASSLGIRIGLREGLLWGIAGFVTFQLAPAAGLAPELPATPAADITDRQIWWYGTVLATAAALALIFYGRKLVLVLAGIVLLTLPHLIGAPHLESYAGIAPPELAATFAARVLAVGLVVWACLGALAGWFWNRTPT